MIRFVVTGRLIWQCERFYYTTEGQFNKVWYRLPIEVELDGNTIRQFRTYALPSRVSSELWKKVN